MKVTHYTLCYTDKKFVGSVKDYTRVTYNTKWSFSNYIWRIILFQIDEALHAIGLEHLSYFRTTNESNCIYMKEDYDLSITEQKKCIVRILISCVVKRCPTIVANFKRLERKGIVRINKMMLICLLFKREITSLKKGGRALC